ncbi:MAG: hypothetical protein JRM88_03645 [Nitrososphaerota archaeon]|nr:hypothetical protein [Nitrososphaerota archaeon]
MSTAPSSQGGGSGRRRKGEHAPNLTAKKGYNSELKSTGVSDRTAPKSRKFDIFGQEPRNRLGFCDTMKWPLEAINLRTLGGQVRVEARPARGEADRVVRMQSADEANHARYLISGIPAHRSF